MTSPAASAIGLRPASQVMRPEWMGAARLTRYSFSRMLIRRAFGQGWRVERTLVDLDDEGRGEVHYRISASGGRPGDSPATFTFVALTTTLDESQHTDRVVADRWEITAALCEGALDPGNPADAEYLARLRTEVPKQEKARLDPRVLVLTRGNRSVRFFQYLVDTLADGRQPDPELVADAGYIMRSTAFYGNGKFGMRSFDGYAAGHPLAVSYRAQFLTAWLFRELSYEVVEHCARARGGDRAVGLANGWDRYFGLGNATGLGLVPYAFAHPAVIDAWVTVREQALADVRSRPGHPHTLARLDAWIDRAARHFATGTDDDCGPFLNTAALSPIVDTIARRLAEVRDEPLPFDALYRWAEEQGPETAELVVSLLIELHDGDDDTVDARYRVDETVTADPGLTVAELLARLGCHYPWLGDLDAADSGDRYWWLITDNAYEPRRVPHEALDPAGRNVMVDVARRLTALGDDLAQRPGDEPVGVLLAERPEHLAAVERLSRPHPYGEPIDNACAADYLPLMVQRFQLATYGMDNFKPKSTDWLRVTLYQGAPRITDLSAASNEGTELDAWIWPPRPEPERQHP